MAHIFWCLDYGGVETMLINIANNQSEMGADISIIVINDLIVPELVKNLRTDIKLIRIDRTKGTKNFSFMRRLNKILLLISPDIIHLHDSVLVNYINKRCLHMSCCVVTQHSMPRGPVGMKWRWGNIFDNIILHHGGNIRAINRIANVFAISNAVAKSLKEDYGIKSEVVLNGIETARFSSRKSNMPEGVFNIVQVSRLDHEKKGQDLLIEAVEYLVFKKGICLHLTFIGEGISRNYLEKMVQERGLLNYVSFMGAQKQDYVARHLCEYDLFVQPSRYEGFGLTVAEAMASKIPVLVSAGQGPSEVTEGDTFGWTFACNDVESLANSIEYIATHYNEALKKVEDAYMHIWTKYDVRNTARSYMEKYKQITEVNQM